MKRVVCTWSGGKDCCLALHEARKMGYEIAALVNMMHEDGATSRSHGLPVKVLELQANKMGLPIVCVPSSNAGYRELFIGELFRQKAISGIVGVVYGDIDLASHRDWQEEVCRDVDLEAIFPIWNKDRIQVSRRIIESGIIAKIVSCNTLLGPSYLGRNYTEKLVESVTKLGVDSCGEEGEFHSLVVDGPMFNSPLKFEFYSAKEENAFHYIDWTNALLS